MFQLETKVLDIIARTPCVKSFRFALNEEITFQAGQFFFVAIRINGQERTKHFSFSNSPTEKGYAEFTKRITPSEYSQALDKIKPGDWARLKMPLGNFTFAGEYNKIAFLSGGIGITPIRSICKFATDKKLPTDIILLYGNNTEADIIFRQDFEEMTKLNRNMRVVHTLTSPDIDKTRWPGRIGLIDAQMLKEEIHDYQERVFYLCGPPKMVVTLTDILNNKLGIGQDKIKLESFTGY